jgi:hypothetical protein
MTTMNHRWIHGTRGTQPGQWYYLRNSNNMRITLLDEDIKPSHDCTGALKPWDWCRDVVPFDPAAPWRAYIPAFDQRAYSYAPLCSWIFPNHATSTRNVQCNTSSWSVHPDIVKHFEILVPSLFHFASSLAVSCLWNGPPPPKAPDFSALQTHFLTPEEVNFHLWTYRRPILDALGFIGYLFLQKYLLQSTRCQGKIIITFP